MLAGATKCHKSQHGLQKQPCWFLTHLWNGTRKAHGGLEYLKMHRKETVCLRRQATNYHKVEFGLYVLKNSLCAQSVWEVEEDKVLQLRRSPVLQDCFWARAETVNTIPFPSSTLSSAATSVECVFGFPWCWTSTDP